MPQLKLTYFDFDGGRGEPARVALAIAGIPFEDDRVPHGTWRERKAQTPFGGLPVLEVDGQPLTQSNAINRYIGRLTDLYPSDPWQAARCDELCDAIEDYNQALGKTMGIADRDALRMAREQFIAEKMTFFLERFARLLEAAGGGFYADGRLTMADLKLADVVRHLQAGNLDFIPADIVERIAPSLDAHRKRVLADPRVKAYYDKRRR